jgi:hypothetical protein
MSALFARQNDKFGISPFFCIAKENFGDSPQGTSGGGLPVNGPLKI